MLDRTPQDTPDSAAFPHGRSTALLAWRGPQVIDCDGEVLGMVTGIFIDGEHEWLTVRSGRFSGRWRLWPHEPAGTRSRSAR